MSHPLDDPIDNTDDDLLDVIASSSSLNDRPGKRDLQSGKVRKWKPKPKVKQPTGGICHILALPEDVMRLLLSRMPPRSLRAMGQTCAGLREILEDESIWKDCYAYTFMRSAQTPLVNREMTVLVQGCLGASQRGWKREALGRETMIERWTTSKSSPVAHTPSVGVIHTLSLSYPPPLPALPAHIEQDAATKMTARQRYDARIAATTRAPPQVFTAALGPGAIVKSDPLTAKVSKGFWGPGRDGNAVYIARRTQSVAIWGKLDGFVVHTSLDSKHPSASGNRAQSVNTICAADDRHSGEVVDVWASSASEANFVTSGGDGVTKYWQYDPPTGKGSKRFGGSLRCLFASTVVDPLEHRPETTRSLRATVPDPILLSRCDPVHDVVCSVSEDGDLRIWIGVSGEPREIRTDVGSVDDSGPLRAFDLDVRSDSISILIARADPFFSRYDIDPVTLTVNERRYTTPLGSRLTAFRALLKPTAPIALHPAISFNDTAASEDKQESPFGRLVIAGDASGSAWMWSWEAAGGETPLRGWSALDRKITALDYHCGVVAVGGCDTSVKVYDPYPAIPVLLRQFRASHLGPGDLSVAESDDATSAWHTVNQITLDNDLFVASIGRRVYAWRAGALKRGDIVKGRNRSSTPLRVNRGPDWRSMREDVRDERLQAAEEHLESGVASKHTRMLDEMGLDADDALQYAMLLSMEQSATQDSGRGSGVPEVDEAIRAVEEFKRTEEVELQEALELVRLAEMS